jgi:hypothetical protein
MKRLGPGQVLGIGRSSVNGDGRIRSNLVLVIVAFFAVEVAFVIASLASTCRKVRDAEREAREPEQAS